MIINIYFPIWKYDWSAAQRYSFLYSTGNTECVFIPIFRVVIANYAKLGCVDSSCHIPLCQCITILNINISIHLSIPL